VSHDECGSHAWLNEGGSYLASMWQNHSYQESQIPICGRGSRILACFSAGATVASSDRSTASGLCTRRRTVVGPDRRAPGGACDVMIYLANAYAQGVSGTRPGTFPVLRATSSGVTRRALTISRSSHPFRQPGLRKVRSPRPWGSRGRSQRRQAVRRNATPWRAIVFCRGLSRECCLAMRRPAL
jgi:hypothetical protein